MESRALRYFVAVAEELSFARAAQRLRMASPPLSRAIRALEAELGVTLFARSTRRVELTPAGTVLLEQARIALDAIEAAGRRTQRAARAGPELVLAVKADGDAGLLDAVLARYAAGPASAPISVRLCGWGEHVSLLRRGDADAALLHEPFDHAGLDSEVVALEPRVAALPAAHPLAGADHVTVADLDLAGVRPDRPGDLDRYVDRVVAVHRVRDLAQLLARVELGDVVAVLPASVVARYPRAGLVYRPLVDAPPATLSIAWPSRSCSRAVAALVRAATSVPAAADASVAG